MNGNEDTTVFEGYDFSQLPECAQKEVTKLWQKICDLEEKAAGTTSCHKIEIRGQITKAQKEIRKIYRAYTNCENAHAVAG